MSTRAQEHKSTGAQEHRNAEAQGHRSTRAEKLLIALCLCAGAASCPHLLAQEVSFKISPPEKKPFLAEPFQLRFEISAPDGYELRPDTASFPAGVFELLGVRAVSSRTDGGRRTAAFDLRVSAFDIGISSFPETVWLLSRGEELKEAKGPELPIEILPVFDPKTEPEGIKDIRPPFGFTPWPYLLAGLLAAGLAAADTRSPYEKAAGALAELAASPLWLEGRIKEFYSRLSGILRDYLDAQLGVKAELMTTGAIARELRAAGAEITAVLKTRALLEKSDLVKFAKLKPQETERDSDLLAMKELLADLNRREEEKRAAAAPAGTETKR